MSGSVFIVEDDLDLLHYYELLLTLEGFEVWGSVTSGEAAILRYRSTDIRPDVVLMDHRLPGCSGLDVARKLLEIDPAARIILATADDSVRDQALAAGVWRFKRKPFDNDILISSIRKAVSGPRSSEGCR